MLVASVEGEGWTWSFMFFCDVNFCVRFLFLTRAQKRQKKVKSEQVGGVMTNMLHLHI